MIKILTTLCLLSFLLVCKQSVGMETDTQIKAGHAKITGKIISPSDTNIDGISVLITVSHPISGEYVKYKALADRSGKFSIEADVETTISVIGFSTSLNPEKLLFVKLINGVTTNIDIAYNTNLDFKNIDVTPDMPKNDMTESMEVMNEMIAHRSGRAPEPLYNKSIGYYLNFAKTILSERLAILKNDTLLSAERKGLLSRDFHLFLYSGHIFPYEEEMIRNYRNINGDDNEKDNIQKIDRSYFRFLKDFNLNDPQYLHCFTFPEFQKTILQNEILGLPVIGESDIPSWLAKIKAILSDLVGFDDGPYYDILAANAYARQLNEEVKPLTEKQQENITSYWKDGEIAKILFRKNQQVVELDKFKSPAVVHDISSVPEDKVVETIVSKYQNKVIIIDLWATWCAPCLDAMQQFKNTKNEFRDKDVVFVYLTNGSSPQKLWEEKIKGIGDEHYYLTAVQWKYVMDHFGLEYIPSYLLFSKEGKLAHKITAFPGNEEMKKKINGLL